MGPTVPKNMNLPRMLATLVHAKLADRAPPLIVALCGWADTGKSTVASPLCAELGQLGISGFSISTDSFMKDRRERNALGISGYNPRSINSQALESAILKFIAREPFAHHPYDNRVGTKQESPKVVAPGDVLVVEGIHAFDLVVAKQMQLRIFFDSDEATLRHMRYRAHIQKRDMKPAEAGARIEGEWQDYCAFIRPLTSSADLIVQVDRHFNYKWPTDSGAPSESSKPTYT